jgi:hypothetical protein
MTLESLRKFGTLTATTATWEEPEIIDAKDVTVLGSVHGRAFIRLPDNREAEVLGPLMPAERGNRPKDGEVWIERVELKRDPVFGRSAPLVKEVEITRAVVGIGGRFGALVEAEQAAVKAKAAAQARKAAPHRVDRAETLPALDRQVAQALALGRTSDDPARALMSPQPAKLVQTAGREPIRGIQTIRVWIEAQGVALRAVGPHLDVSSRRLDPATREVIETFRPLLHGLLSGQPVVCGLPHRTPEQAWTIAVPDLPICRRHLEEVER